MAVYQAAVDDTASLNWHGTVFGATYPLTVVRVRCGRSTSATAINKRTMTVERTATLGTATALTPEKMNSRSPAADNTANGTYTVSGSRTGNPLLMAASGISPECVADWTPPSPSAVLSLEPSASAGYVLFGVTDVIAWGFTTADAERAGLPRAAIGRSRGRRPRTSLVHSGAWGTVQGVKTAAGAYSVNRQTVRWACWRLPRTYRSHVSDGGLNTALAPGPSRHGPGTRTLSQAVQRASTW